MSPNDTRLALALRRISDASDGLADWVATCERLIPSERVALQDEFTRTSARAHAVAGQLKQAPTLGVVGPPRSGKTHIVSSLLTEGSTPLTVRFDGITQRLGVIRQIVPVGTRQQMTCATRFSNKLRLFHRGFPLSLRVLSLAEIVEILGTAYLTSVANDGVPLVTAADVRVSHRRAEARLSDQPVVGLSETDTLALKEYFCARFGREPHVQALTTAGFWDSLTELAPYLDDHGRADFLARLWGGIGLFDTAFRKLAETLVLLGHGREAASTLDAIVDLDPQSGQFVRRPDSILAMQGLSGIASDGGVTTVVCNQFGQWHSVDRSALAALVAEVKLPVDASPGTLADQADIVELPGILRLEGRARLDGGHDEDAQRFVRMFGRAKQFVLHARAVMNNEITAMLVCREIDGDGIGELAPIVADWVHKTHGATPELREAAVCGLFVVATKPDRLFVDTGNKSRERTIDWEQAISGALADDFGRYSDWPLTWTPSRPFDNMAMVLAPAFKTTGLFEQGNGARPAMIKSGLKGRVTRARRDFLESRAVARHMAAPAAVWQDVLKPGDGGIARLSKAIADVCHSRTKYRQLFAEAIRLRDSVKDSSLRYCPGELPQLPFDRRYAMALLVVRRLRSVAENRRFNRLLGSMTVSDSDLAEVFRDLEGRLTTAETANGPSSAMLARAAIDTWIGRIRELVRGQGAEVYYHVPESVLRHMVDELVVGANRIDLESRIVRQIHAADVATLPSHARVEAAAVCASFAINSYLFYLGFDNLLTNDHPRRRDQADTRIFAPRKEWHDVGAVTSTASPELEQHDDWSQAYMAFVDENARELRERALPADEAMKLASCLSVLEAAQ